MPRKVSGEGALLCAHWGLAAVTVSAAAQCLMGLVSRRSKVTQVVAVGCAGTVNRL